MSTPTMSTPTTDEHPPSTTRAFLVGRHGVADGPWRREVADVPLSVLGEDGVLIEVSWSGINYKDGLASSAQGRVARLDPLVPGVDLAGTIADLDDDARARGLAVGDEVIVHAYDLGVAHHGGFARHARVPADWVVPMPDGLDARSAMLVGTAGFTAALSVVALEGAGLRPGDGEVLVTGATGGVGSMAVGMLAARGHHVVASSGKRDAAAWLTGLGAADVVDRDTTSASSNRPLESERWAGAVDCVGGDTLAYVLRTLRYGGSVAASGLTGGSGLTTTVMPFILRGVNLLGIDSVRTPLAHRHEVWRRVATDLRPPWLAADDAVDAVIGLDELPEHLDRILLGGMRGRVLVDPRR